MKRKNITMHAQKRMQQRAISDIAILLIDTFGECRYQSGGAYEAYIPEKTITGLRHALDKISNVIAIYGESDKLVTAMHGTRRLRSTNYKV